MDLETRINAAKSKIAKDFAERTGLEKIDIRISTLEPTDLRGLPYPDLSIRGAVNEAIDRVVEERLASADINLGDTVLMEYAEGVVETVIVEEIVDGIVYGLGDDGEPFCAPIANCDKVPF